MGIARVRLDSGEAGSSGSSGGFNWPAGNLALQPQAPQRESASVPRDVYAPGPASYNGGTVPSVQQAAPSQYGYAPALNGGQGINPNAPLSGPANDVTGGGGIPDIPAAPPQGGRQWYNNLDQAGQQAADAQWLGGDSDYTAQIAEYDKALKSFIDRIAEQRKGFTSDANLATQSTERNQNMSLDNLGEDFGARGLSYSGLFDTSKNQTNQRFNEAKSGIERMRAKNDSDAVNRETDYRAENQISRNNAQRASTGRQAQRQALIDSMNGF